MKENFLYRSRRELKRLQNRKLYSFITRHLYPFSPYYRALFDKNKIKPDSIKTVEDLQRLPFTSKKDFLSLEDKGDKYVEFVLAPDENLIRRYLPKAELAKFLALKALKGKEWFKDNLEKEYRPLFLTATTGTTNKPIPFLYTHYDLENLKCYGKRVIDIFGVNRNERAVNVFPYAPHLAFWQTVFAGFSADLFILSTGGGKTLGTEGNIRSILMVKPEFLIGVPGYIYHILKTAQEQNIKMESINKIALGAARVPKGFKKKISNILAQMGSHGVKVLGTYGFTESRCVWAECPTEIDISSGYHTYPDKEIFEVIDPDTGEVKGEGEDGELVYSNIDARGSCVLRYRTGDLVKGGIIYSPCPHCGRTVPRISSDIIRASNIKNIQLSKIKGTLVDLNTLEYILDDSEFIDEWQVEITKKNNDPYEVEELILYVSLSQDINREDFIRQLNEKTVSGIEVSFNKVNFSTRSEILHRLEIESAVKAKKIVDKRPKA